MKYVVALVSLLLSLAALELLLSFRLPFAHNVWPSAFDPRLGPIFQPHAEVRWTNHLDYAVEERTNALGFLDREPPGAKAPDAFRVLVLGDSFVEAFQVPNAQKVHVVLEGLLARAYPRNRVETSALARSGAGSSAELAYYEAHGRALDPDLVVLVFVDNDFSDNSPLLGAIDNGWHPDHPPWPLFARDSETDGFRPIPPDAAFVRHQLDGPPAAGATRWLTEHLGWSRLVRWSVAILREGAASQRHERAVTRRLERLRGDERFRPKLEAWRYPDDLEPKEMFFAREMPPVFHDALAITDHVFGRFAAEKERDGFAMMVAAIPECSITPPRGPQQREMIERGQLVRLGEIAARHGIRLLDLGPAFAAKADPEAAHWRHDGHWTPTGHRWAAEAIAEFVVAHEGTLAPGRREAR